jgi:hypothetical protein
MLDDLEIVLISPEQPVWVPWRARSGVEILAKLVQEAEELFVHGVRRLMGWYPP